MPHRVAQVPVLGAFTQVSNLFFKYTNISFYCQPWESGNYHLSYQLKEIHNVHSWTASKHFSEHTHIRYSHCCAIRTLITNQTTNRWISSICGWIERICADERPVEGGTETFNTWRWNSSSGWWYGTTLKQSLLLFTFAIFLCKGVDSITQKQY